MLALGLKTDNTVSYCQESRRCVANACANAVNEVDIGGFGKFGEYYCYHT